MPDCAHCVFSCLAGRGDQHTEAGSVVQGEAAGRAQTETGRQSSERVQEQPEQRLARHADLHGVSSVRECVKQSSFILVVLVCASSYIKAVKAILVSPLTWLRLTGHSVSK